MLSNHSLNSCNSFARTVIGLYSVILRHKEHQEYLLTHGLKVGNNIFMPTKKSPLNTADLGYVPNLPFQFDKADVEDIARENPLGHAAGRGLQGMFTMIR